jgi:hypothetical protein
MSPSILQIATVASEEIAFSVLKRSDRRKILIGEMNKMIKKKSIPTAVITSNILRLNYFW